MVFSVVFLVLAFYSQDSFCCCATLLPGPVHSLLQSLGWSSLPRMIFLSLFAQCGKLVVLPGLPVPSGCTDRAFPFGFFLWFGIVCFFLCLYVQNQKSLARFRSLFFGPHPSFTSGVSLASSSFF